MSYFIERLILWDTKLFSRICRWNGKRILDFLMHWISRSGDGYLYGIIGVALPVSDIAQGWYLVKIGLVAFAFELPAATLIKRLVKRPRPCASVTDMRFVIHPPDRFSFPSGHSAASAVMATLFAFCYPAIAVPVTAWAALVGLSRVYLGVHYPADVLSGFLIGLSCATLGIALVA